jgi:hypothetical protein
MKVTGYSERGVLNSLLYEIAYRERPEQHLADLLRTAHFPFCNGLDLTIENARILVEQSLSDFGVADAILLLVTPSQRMTVFVEAKVREHRVSGWGIDAEFEKFMRGTESEVDSSNLFTQLYHRVRFAHELRKGGPEAVAAVSFPASSSTMVRKIGKNPVVLNVRDRIYRHLDEVYFLAVVPDEREIVSRFFQDKLKQNGPTDYEEWDTSCYGHLSWHEVEAFCANHGLTRTLEVLEFNGRQIY